jgi:hypothetical protein
LKPLPNRKRRPRSTPNRRNLVNTSRKAALSLSYKATQHIRISLASITTKLVTTVETTTAIFGSGLGVRMSER